MVRKFFYGEDPLGKKAKKPTGTGAASGQKKLFGMNASAFIQKKMAEQQAKEDDKDEKK